MEQHHFEVQKVIALNGRGFKFANTKKNHQKVNDDGKSWEAQRRHGRCYSCVANVA